MECMFGSNCHCRGRAPASSLVHLAQLPVSAAAVVVEPTEDTLKGKRYRSTGEDGEVGSLGCYYYSSTTSSRMSVVRSRRHDPSTR